MNFMCDQTTQTITHAHTTNRADTHKMRGGGEHTHTEEHRLKLSNGQNTCYI